MTDFTPELISHLESLKGVHRCDFVPAGHLRVQTNFQFADGHIIDVFVHSRKKLVTDFGNLWSHLFLMGYDMTQQDKRIPMLQRLQGSVTCGLRLPIDIDDHKMVGSALLDIANMSMLAEAYVRQLRSE